MPDLGFRKAAKFWVALVGVVATTLVASASEVPSWVPALAAICTAVSVFLVPNDVPWVAEPVDPDADNPESQDGADANG